MDRSIYDITGYEGVNKDGLEFVVLGDSGKRFQGKVLYIVEFRATGNQVVKVRDKILKGQVRDTYNPTVCGIGYLGSAKTPTKYHLKEYRHWIRLLSKCYNPRDINYPSYGAKGVTVDKRWHNFSNFLEDTRRPQPQGLNRYGSESMIVSASSGDE